MISAVNSCNSVAQTKPIQFKGEQISVEPTEKEGMSTTTKTLLGLGGLATIAIGGLLVHKHINAKNVEDIATKAKRLLEKPNDFSDDLFKQVVNKWKEAGKFNPENGDTLWLMKKAELLASGWKGNYNELHKAMNLSDNAFVLAANHDGKIIFRYFDPKTISSKYVNEAMAANDTLVEMKIVS